RKATEEIGLLLPNEVSEIIPGRCAGKTSTRSLPSHSGLGGRDEVMEPGRWSCRKKLLNQNRVPLPAAFRLLLRRFSPDSSRITRTMPDDLPKRTPRVKVNHGTRNRTGGCCLDAIASRGEGLDGVLENVVTTQFVYLERRPAGQIV